MNRVVPVGLFAAGKTTSGVRRLRYPGMDVLTECWGVIVVAQHKLVTDKVGKVLISVPCFLDPGKDFRAERGWVGTGCISPERGFDTCGTVSSP